MGSVSDLVIVIDAEEGAAGSKNIFRVPDYLKSFSPDHFKPMEWRLGLHTHTRLSTTDGGLDIFKVEVARMLARGPGAASSPGEPRDLMASKTWQDFWQDLDLKKAEAAYDCRTPAEDQAGGIQHPPAVLLAIDALFLCAYLRSIRYSVCWGYPFRRVFRDSRFEARRYPFYRDLLILDNQVPMPLLLAVIRHLTKAEALREPIKEDLADADLDTLARETLNSLLLEVVACVYPFNHGVELDLESEVLSKYLAAHFSTKGPDALWRCDHVLACAYLAICGGENPEVDSDADTQDDETRPKRQSWSSKYREWSRPGKDKKRAAEARYRNRYRVPSATNLRRSGVKFKVTDDSLRLSNIKFDMPNHTLLLPKLVMDDHTATRFRNLALYEQLQVHARPDFRTYLLLMSSLVDNAQDVRLLIESNVLVNHLSNDEAAARDWNGMCEGLFIPPNPPKYWLQLQERISKYDKARHNRWMADFRTANCADPWRITAFALACIFTAASFLQAAISFASYDWR